MEPGSNRSTGLGVRKFVTAVRAMVASACLITGCAMEPIDTDIDDVAEIEVTLTPIQQFGIGTFTPITAQGELRELGYVSAVAASGGYVFVVDSTIPGLLRLNPASGESTVLRVLEDAGNAGLYARPDMVVYLVDRYNRMVLELGESGFERRVFEDSSLIPVPVDVTQTNWGSSVLIADELTQRLAVFDRMATPAGALPSILSPVAVAASINAIAATDDMVFVLDSASREVMQLDLYGRIVATYGEDELVAPVAMTVDECQRIYVADGHADGLFVTSRDFYGTSARAALPAELALAVTDLWIDGDDLYVAAGAAGVHVLLVEPRCMAQ